MSSQAVAVREPGKVEGELSISLSEMLGLLAVCEEPEDSGSAVQLDQSVRDNVANAVSDKLRRYQNFFSFCDAQANQCQSEIERLRARKQAIENAKERLRKYLARAMEQHGVRRLDAGTVVFTLRSGAESLVITDADKLPGQYFEERIVVDIDKATLKRAIKAGEPIEGAEIVVGEPFVVAR